MSNVTQKKEWDELGAFNNTCLENTKLEELALPWHKFDIRLGTISYFSLNSGELRIEIDITIHLAQGKVSNRIALCMTANSEHDLRSLARILECDKEDKEYREESIITTLPLNILRKAIKVFYIWNNNNIRSYCQDLHLMVRELRIKEYPKYLNDSKIHGLLYSKINQNCDLCLRSLTVNTFSWEPLPAEAVLFLHELISKYKNKG